MSNSENELAPEERARRYRLLLGSTAEDANTISLSAADQAIDRALSYLYDSKEEGGGRRAGGLGKSAPNVAHWLADIRTYFPSSVVRIMQKDAIERLRLTQLILEPELLEAAEPDIGLVATLMTLQHALPARSRDSARAVVRRVADQLLKKLEQPMRSAVAGSLARSIRNTRPRHNEIDWLRTIRANLRHYLPEHRTLIPERRIGSGRKRSSLRDIILCIDQSGSMANSAVYSGIFSCVLASMPSVSTHVVAFDTQIVDLTEKMQDPVDLLFGIRLGGGTDINRALAYCQTLIRRPNETVLVLISDLIEGGVRQEMLRRAGQMMGAGVQFVALLALSDEGAPIYDHQNAAALAAMGAPAFACTPDLFPSLMAAALQRQDIAMWAATEGIATG